jgi:transposase InsO family protein
MAVLGGGNRPVFEKSCKLGDEQQSYEGIACHGSSFDGLLARGNRERGLIHHSDRGSQYAGCDYRKLLGTYGMICSMSRKGDCRDNAVAESFFHSLKTEWTAEIIYRTRSDARSDVIQHIEMFYNSHRLHFYLGYKNPNDFEKNFILAKAA